MRRINRCGIDVDILHDSRILFVNVQLYYDESQAASSP